MKNLIPGIFLFSLGFLGACNGQPEHKQTPQEIEAAKAGAKQEADSLAQRDRTRVVDSGSRKKAR